MVQPKALPCDDRRQAAQTLVDRRIVAQALTTVAQLQDAVRTGVRVMIPGERSPGAAPAIIEARTSSAH